MRILVTGGAGFIGSHFVRSMLADRYDGHEATRVTVLDKLAHGGRRENLPAGGARLSFIEGDICDAELLAQLLPGHDAVVHFAGESHVDRSVCQPELFVWTNVLGTQRLMEQCRRARIPRVVYVSTDEVYGSIHSGSWTETAPIEPNSPYAASKAAGECVVRSYWRTWGLDVSITRCSNNYGPYQALEKFVPRSVTRLLSGRPVQLHGDGRAVREWLHVDDHCRAIAMVLDKGRAGEVYNIGGGVELTNRGLTARLLALCGLDWDRVRHVPDRPVQDQRYSLDSSKIADELGFRPVVDFGHGLADVVRWYRDNQTWWRTDPDAQS